MDSSAVISRPRALYAGVFLVAMVTLVLQVVTTRLFSVLTWYHLAFLVISLAMLGMTAAGLYVYLRRVPDVPRDLATELASHATRLAFSIPLSHFVLISLPIPTEMTFSSSHIGIMTLTVAAAAAPFFFSGVAIVLALSQPALPMFATTFPVGFALGVFFPIGMRLLEGRSRVARSWMWGLNGAFGVLGSLLAVVLSMTLGIRSCMIAAALLYLALVFPLRGLLHARAAERPPLAVRAASGSSQASSSSALPHAKSPYNQ